MNKNRVVGILAALVLGLFVWKYLAANVYGPSDETLIKRALEEAILASREGRPGGVMDFISDKFKVNTQEPGGRQIANFIKNSHPDVTLPSDAPIISENTARITGTVRVKISYLGMNLDQSFGNVSLVFEREQAHEWVVIPVRKWRLSQVLVPESAVASGIGAQD